MPAPIAYRLSPGSPSQTPSECRVAAGAQPALQRKWYCYATTAWAAMPTMRLLSQSATRKSRSTWTSLAPLAISIVAWGVRANRYASTMAAVTFDALYRYAQTRNLSQLDVTAEEQGSDYQAGHVEIDGQCWRTRTARVTPRKPGAFVAVWRRNAHGKTEPFSIPDTCAGLLVFVEEDGRLGVFTFPDEALGKLGIYSSRQSAGKRGFRLYPAWSVGLNAQAARTQAKQAAFFEELTRA